MDALRTAVSILAISLGGCISHVHYPYAASADPTGYTAPGPFAVPSQPVHLQLHEEQRSTRYYQVQRFNFPATGVNGQRGNQVGGRYFRGTGAALRPAVIILPVWGISEYPSRKMARDLARRSKGRIDILLVESDGYLIDWPALRDAPTEARFSSLVQQSAVRVQNAVIDTRRMTSWLAAQPQIDQNNIAVIGFSLSAVVAALALQHEPVLGAGVVVMGGSDPAGIFANCGGRPGEVRAAITSRFNWTVEHYREVFLEAMHAGDAGRYAGRIADPSRVLLIEARYDDCMPRDSRQRLWQALGRPERISFGFRHRGTFYAMTPLGFNTLSRYAVKFLEARLLPKR